MSLKAGLTAGSRWDLSWDNHSSLSTGVKARPPKDRPDKIVLQDRECGFTIWYRAGEASKRVRTTSLMLRAARSTGSHDKDWDSISHIP